MPYPSSVYRSRLGLLPFGPFGFAKRNVELNPFRRIFQPESIHVPSLAASAFDDFHQRIPRLLHPLDAGLCFVQLESENDALRADLLLWEEKEAKP